MGEVAPGDPSATIDSTRGIDPTGDRPTGLPAGRPYHYQSRGRVTCKEIKGFLRPRSVRDVLSRSSIARCGKPACARAPLCLLGKHRPPALQRETRGGEGFIEAGYVISGSTTGVYHSAYSLLSVSSSLLWSARCAEMRKRRICRGNRTKPPLHFVYLCRFNPRAFLQKNCSLFLSSPSPPFYLSLSTIRESRMFITLISPSRK